MRIYESKSCRALETQIFIHLFNQSCSHLVIYVLVPSGHYIVILIAFNFIPYGFHMCLLFLTGIEVFKDRTLLLNPPIPNKT